MDGQRTLVQWRGDAANKQCIAPVAKTRTGAAALPSESQNATGGAAKKPENGCDRTKPDRERRLRDPAEPTIRPFDFTLCDKPEDDSKNPRRNARGKQRNQAEEERRSRQGRQARIPTRWRGFKWPGPRRRLRQPHPARPAEPRPASIASAGQHAADVTANGGRLRHAPPIHTRAESITARVTLTLADIPNRSAPASSMACAVGRSRMPPAALT